MKVYMTGLIYLNGCNQDVTIAYAPNGAGHHASLWIEAPQINEALTQWWSGFRHGARDVDGVGLIEFVIPGPAVLRFPGQGAVACSGLEEGLPKLKKKKKGKKKKDDDPDEPEEEFDVDPATAQTNAEVTLRGGTVEPRRFGNFSLVEWTITDPGVAIIAESKNNADDSRTITLNGADAEVLFLNMHDLPDVHREPDLLAGEHVANFRNLNPDPNVSVYSVSAKVPGRAGQLVNENIVCLKFLKNAVCSCGSGTPCCCRA